MPTLAALLCFALASVHTLVAAVWLGAMFYSYSVLHPKAAQYFRKSEEFEDFIRFVSAGGRWKVVGALATIAVSGAGLTLLEQANFGSAVWVGAIALIVGVTLAASLLFVFVSWRMWPERLFAAPEDAPLHQKRFRRVAQVMLLLAALGCVFGVAAHKLR